MFSKFRYLLFGLNTPNYGFSIPWTSDKMSMIDKINGTDVTVMLNHPNWITAYIVSNNLSSCISDNNKQSFRCSYFIDLERDNIFLDYISWAQLLKYSVFIGKDVYFLVAATCYNEILEKIQSTNITIMTEMIFSQLIHCSYRLVLNQF